MDWLRIPLALVIVFVGGFGATFLSSAWERRRKRDENLDRLKAALPGLDCGLCGHASCRNYAREILETEADPGLCGPGGRPVEKALRENLGRRRASRQVAFVHCGGTRNLAATRYDWDGGGNCAAAAALYEGPRGCENACMGLGSCASVCPLGAIQVSEGIAKVNARICSGCGLCVDICPKAVIRLVPVEAQWQVACNSPSNAEEKAGVCKVACTGCGECERLSPAWEFTVAGNLARVSGKAEAQPSEEAMLTSIASHCPTGAIVRREKSAESAKKA